MAKPKSPRTRMREYRERTKQNKQKREEILEKDKARKQAERLKEREIGISSEKKAHRNSLNRQRVTKCRSKKKINFEESEKPAFTTRSSLGRAVSRASKSLPLSPRKKKAVVNQLAERVGIIKSSIKPKTILSDEVKEKVRNFYSRDDISRQAPGKKDCVTLWKEGGKIKLQKRHLYYTIKETHSLFLHDHPDVKIGKSKFAELKPPNVFHQSKTPKDACLCKYHENIALLCDALHKVIPTFPIYSSSFVDNMVCSPDSEKCMMGNCDTCSYHKIESYLSSFVEADQASEILWCEWVREENNEIAHPRRGANKEADTVKTSSKKQMKKICKAGSVAEAVATLIEKMPEFLAHVFIKRQQSACFQEKLSDIPDASAVIQVDFSENYSLQQQGEIQSAYWSQQQLTLFTVCVWTHDSNKSMVFVSDDLDHDKTSVLVFLHKLLAELTDKETIKNVDIFSDGPSSQFKNQYVFNFLPVLRELYHLESLNWHFFATSHGKGAVDGIGGTVKRNVWMETLSRRAVINSLEDFCEVARKKEQHVEVIAVTAASIKSCSADISLEESFASSTAVKGIKKMHYVTALQDGKIICKEYTRQECNDDVSQQDSKTDESDSDKWYDDRCQQLAPHPVHINVEDFVICKYEGEVFPGQVTAVHPEGKGARIKVFEKCAGGWRWPKHVDEIDYLQKDIIQHIKFPQPINNRGTYRIIELESRWGTD